MTLFNNIPGRGFFKDPVITIGNFDGVHLGHQKILNTLIKEAKKQKGTPVVVTFESHPRKVLFPDNPIKIITTNEEKIQAINSLGIENVILLNFTKQMANMNADEFYNSLLVEKLGAKKIVIGYDHAFGKNREGNIHFLKDLEHKSGIGITRVDGEVFENKPVSSTWLRNEIHNGNMDMVTKLLGRVYSITGSVVKGVGRGRKLGFPTANVKPDDSDKMYPGDGVYAVTVKIKDVVKKGMLNIGFNPTFFNTVRTIEANIFDFNEDIYNDEVTVNFHHKVRNEIKFDGPEGLIKQLEKDKLDVLDYFAHEKQ